MLYWVALTSELEENQCCARHRRPPGRKDSRSAGGRDRPPWTTGADIPLVVAPLFSASLADNNRRGVCFRLAAPLHRLLRTVTMAAGKAAGFRARRARATTPPRQEGLWLLKPLLLHNATARTRHCRIVVSENGMACIAKLPLAEVSDGASTKVEVLLNGRHQC
jgi:hypothetical protein